MFGMLEKMEAYHSYKEIELGKLPGSIDRSAMEARNSRGELDPMLLSMASSDSTTPTAKGENCPIILLLDPVSSELHPTIGQLDPLTGDLDPVLGQLDRADGELDPSIGPVAPSILQPDPLIGELAPRGLQLDPSVGSA